MKLWLLRLRNSYGAVQRLFWSRPSYIGIAAMVGFISLTILLWAFNLNLIGYIITNGNLSLAAKISFFLSVYANVFVYFGDPQATALVIIAPLVGINVATAIFVMRARAKELTGVGRGTFAMAGALLGSGCAVCGTGILAPLLAGLGGSTAIVAAKLIGVTANLVAIFLLLYSIYGLGKVLPSLGVNKFVANSVYQCSECGLHYPDKTTAEACKAWCSQHKSCNLQITRVSIEVNKSRK